MTEGESVSLNTGLTEIKQDDLILWQFGKYLIAEINVTAGSMYMKKVLMGDSETD